MNFSPEQMMSMVSMDPSLSERERMIIIGELQQAQNAGLSVLTPGRLYSVGLSALAGWLVGKLVTGTTGGGIMGSLIGGGLALGSGQPNGLPSGFSLDHSGSVW